MTTAFTRILLLSSAASALSLAPSTAEAGLPGWGVDGSPKVDTAWCHGEDRHLYQGDFNGDGKTDLLCHNDATGRKRIDFSDPDQRGFWGTDWELTQSWCVDPGERILVGDYNGDGRDDLLCYVARGHANAGRKRIDFANGSGTFYGTEFDSQSYPTAAQTWCTNAGESLHVGDYNGDGKDDLLCHVKRGHANAGRKRIDFANGSGTFFGTDFNTEDYPSAAQTWCTNDGESLHVGDFNGDGKDDLVCFVGRGYADAGRRRIDFANSAGTFFGTDFDSKSHVGADQDWCTAFGDDRPMVGDFNRDGKDDLLCANDYYGGLRVDHANSAGTLFGTDGTEHWEPWCGGNTSSYFVGDFDGDSGADVLCHDRSSGYRGIRYANDGGDFYSVCSNASAKGDGALGPLPVHFVVAVNPQNPAVPGRTRIPTATSTHVNPFDLSAIDQSADPSRFFRVEVDVMNERTYDTNYDSVCVGADCISYEYESHAFYEDIKNTTCTEVLKYANPPDWRYGQNCKGVGCFPNTCGSTSWNGAYGCAIRECDDPRVRKPGALTVVIMDRCNWDGGISAASCAATRESFGFGATSGKLSSWGAPDFFTAWDFDRVLRGPGAQDIDWSWGVEAHEVGHVLSLGHTWDCTNADTSSQNENPMHKYPGAGQICRGNEDADTIWDRQGGYSHAIIPHDGPQAGVVVDQIDEMVSAARAQVDVWSCN